MLSDWAAWIIEIWIWFNVAGVVFSCGILFLFCLFSYIRRKEREPWNGPGSRR